MGRWWHKQQKKDPQAPLVQPMELCQMPEEAYEPCAFIIRFPGTDDNVLVRAFESVYDAGQSGQLVGSTVNEALERYRAHTYFEQQNFRMLCAEVPFGFHRHVKRRIRYVTLVREPVEHMMAIYEEETAKDGDDRESFEAWVFHRPKAKDNMFTRRLCGVPEVANGGELREEHLELAKHNLATYFAAVGLNSEVASLIDCCKERFAWPVSAGYGAVLESPDPVSETLRKRLEARLRYDVELYEFVRSMQGANRVMPENEARPDLSVVFGTYNRIWHLTRCITSLRQCMGGLSYELVVCDAGSTDGSREWLASQSDVVLVGERVREGAVRAFNKGFWMSRGHAVALWNDDVVAVDNNALERAVKALYEPGVGQVACAFNVRDGAQFSAEHVHGIPFANLGVITRKLADAIAYITGGLWSPCYRTYGADTELSCWVSRLGFRVAQLHDARFTDLRVDDGLRALNQEKAREDSRLFWARWPDASMIQPNGKPPNVTGPELARLAEVIRHEIRIEKPQGEPSQAIPGPFPDAPPSGPGAKAPHIIERVRPEAQRAQATGCSDATTVIIHDGKIIRSR